MLESALAYADEGFRVFPLHEMKEGACSCGTKCGSPAKHPRIGDWDERATTNHAIIQAWWETWPTANIGIATGLKSGLWVLDVDAKQSVQVGEALISEGEHSLRRLELEYGTLPETPVVETSSGGQHLYFAFPVDGTYGNRAGIRPSIDVRGEGGYVVAPPSIGRGGRAYRWVTEEKVPVNPPPAWLLDLANDNAKGLKKLEPGQKVREGEGRHDYLYRFACSMRGVHAFEGHRLFGVCMAENVAVCDPPLLKDEVEHIVQNAEKFPPNQAPPHFDLEMGDDTPDPELPAIPDGADIPISLFDLMTNPPERPPALIEGLLDEGTGMILASRPNLGKTWVALDMALAIATGTPFLGLETHQAPVVYVDEEGSIWNDYERLRMLLGGRGVGTTLDVPLYLSVGRGIRLDRPEGLVIVRRMVERVHPKLIIFDALVRMHGGDENSAREMADFFSTAKRLMQHYGLSICFLHHVRKPGLNDDPSDPHNLVRGSSDIMGWPDTVDILMPSGDVDTIHAYNTKQRNHRREDPFVLKLDVDDDMGIARLVNVGPIPDDQPTQANTHQGVFEAIARIEMGGNRATVDAIAVEMGRASSSIRPVVKGLVSTGRLVDYLIPNSRLVGYRPPSPQKDLPE